jgi:hypothetical protein
MTAKWYVVFVLVLGAFAWALERRGHGELGLLLFGLSMSFALLVAVAVERLADEMKSVRQMLQELLDDPALQSRKEEHRREWLRELWRLDELKRGGHPVSDYDMDDAYCRAHGLSREAAEKYKDDMDAHRRQQQLKEEQERAS